MTSGGPDDGQDVTVRSRQETWKSGRLTLLRRLLRRRGPAMILPSAAEWYCSQLASQRQYLESTAGLVYVGDRPMGPVTLSHLRGTLCLRACRGRRLRPSRKLVS